MSQRRLLSRASWLLKAEADKLIDLANKQVIKFYDRIDQCLMEYMYAYDTSSRGHASATNWVSQGRKKMQEMVAAEATEAAQVNCKAARAAKGKADNYIKMFVHLRPVTTSRSHAASVQRQSQRRRRI